MCNRFRMDPDKIQTWAEYSGYNLEQEQKERMAGEAFPASPNSTESKYPGVVVRMVDGAPRADLMPWGIVTTIKGAKGQPIKKPVTNVRNLTSPFWRSLLANPSQRCLVPFTTFAEPVIGGGQACHWFSIPSRPVACFAGVWRWSEGVERFAFLTCEPNPLVAPLHPKAMPVILAQEDEATWLSGDLEAACGLTAPYPSQLMEVA